MRHSRRTMIPMSAPSASCLNRGGLGPDGIALDTQAPARSLTTLKSLFYVRHCFLSASDLSSLLMPSGSAAYMRPGADRDGAAAVIAAEQLVEPADLVALAHDVPQRDVDAGDGLRGGRARWIVLEEHAVFRLQIWICNGFWPDHEGARADRTSSAKSRCMRECRRGKEAPIPTMPSRCASPMISSRLVAAKPSPITHSYLR